MRCYLYSVEEEPSPVPGDIDYLVGPHRSRSDTVLNMYGLDEAARNSVEITDKRLVQLQATKEEAYD